MRKLGRGIVGFLLVWIGATWAVAQTGAAGGMLYPLVDNGGQWEVAGFVPFEHLKEEEIYANAFLWAVEEVCPKQLEGMSGIDGEAKTFACDFVLASEPGSALKNTYYFHATFRCGEGKLLYRLSEVWIESAAFVMKKVTPLEKLMPEKKASHKQTVDDFIAVESRMLNSLFDFVATHSLSPITHWPEIRARKPVAGMTEQECRLAFGKPQRILESAGEVQWMYTSSFYLFFKAGRVQTIIK